MIINAEGECRVDGFETEGESKREGERKRGSGRGKEKERQGVLHFIPVENAI